MADNTLPVPKWFNARKILELVVEGRRTEDIAAQLGTSQGPVREALQRLEREGLVRRHAHISTFVTELSDEEISALYAYLRTVPPINNKVPKSEVLTVADAATARLFVAPFALGIFNALYPRALPAALLVHTVEGIAFYANNKRFPLL